MIYKPFSDLSLSMLGMGNMRLPTTGGPQDPIDSARAMAIIDRVIAGGVNYFDTAYMYHDGRSEPFLKEALGRYPRESYFLADKMFPDPITEGRRTPETMFEEQLARCGTDYFDFYLLHSVTEPSLPFFTDEKYGVIPYLLSQKKAGRIRHLGLSSHARPETLAAFLAQWDFPEFVQIQLNYLDWTMQDAKTAYEAITARGLPVWVMEPCRGGRLASLGAEADAILRAARPGASVASWAFRFVQSLPGVQVVLSGMSDLLQVEDNLATFAAPDPLTAPEREALDAALALFQKQFVVPCTRCRYCNGCPMELDIPDLLGKYNELCVSDDPSWAKEECAAMPAAAQPKNCVACGQCAAKCPQGIDIPGVLARFAEQIG